MRSSSIIMWGGLKLCFHFWKLFSTGKCQEICRRVWVPYLIRSWVENPPFVENMLWLLSAFLSSNPLRPCLTNHTSSWVSYQKENKSPLAFWSEAGVNEHCSVVIANPHESQMWGKPDTGFCNQRESRQVLGCLHPWVTQSCDLFSGNAAPSLALQLHLFEFFPSSSTVLY